MPRTRDPARSPRRDATGRSGPARPGGITHAERLRTELAEEIARGRLTPGTALDETSLAERFGVSRTPVREALRELAAAGLIEYRPHRGAVVTALSAERVDEMFQVMAELEALCAASAAVAMTAAERAELGAMHQQAAELVRLGDLAGYTEANDRFHAFIYTASHNGFLAETVLGVRRRVVAFRRAQFSSLGRLTESHREHDRVVQALLRGDREAAAREMRAHLTSSGRSYSQMHDGL
ncbi:MAG: GntR family transcriptional regulator [Hyphomicrobiaceae bacterium]|nr:GntR family transcriptional regulator [Hyphomicrobiaceae bacterium]